MGTVGQDDGEGWLALDGRMDAQDPDLGGSKRVNPTISPNCPPREVPISRFPDNRGGFRSRTHPRSNVTARTHEALGRLLLSRQGAPLPPFVLRGLS